MQDKGLPLLKQSLKAGKGLGKALEINPFTSAPVFQFNSAFSSAETTEMSGKCVACWQQVKRLGAAGNKEGHGGSAGW